VKVKIGIANADRVVEIETNDAEALRQKIEEAYNGGSDLLWFEDNKKRMVGVPRERIAYVEFDTEAASRTVGFSKVS
jgi:hypothetical protein